MKIQNIYISSKLILQIICWGLCTLFYVPLSANNRITQEADSLKQILNQHSEPHILIPILSRLAKLYEQTPEGLDFLKRQYHMAMRIDSIPAAYPALTGLSCYYYNLNEQRDSILYWGELVDSIAKSRNEYPNALFDVKRYACQDLLWSKNYEMAMNDAINLYRLASRINHTYGLVRCSESLGLIYRAIRRDSDAIVSYKEALTLLDEIKDKQNTQAGFSSGQLETQLRVTSLLAESSLRINQFKQTEEILARYKQLIDKQKEINDKGIDIYPINRDYSFLYSTYTQLYINQNKLDKAKQALDSAAIYQGVYVPGDYVELTYLYVQALYHKANGNLTVALRLINDLLERDYIAEELQLKADILKEQGKMEEALVLYDEIFKLGKKLNDETFFRQINQLRTLHDINKKQVQDHDLQLNKQRIIHKQRQLILSGVVVFILLVLLYILFIYYRRAQQLKNELQREKESLLESEGSLIREKIKAEEASRMKSAFIANMSHEIRTPLNAIVGFSGLLIDESTEPEEREEYSSVIKNNTDMLLNLVNDVLDLSRMETGDLNFNLKRYPLMDCCQKALDSTRHRVPPGVELTFTPESEPIMLYTDTLRLQQLLINLLSNAAKFTMKGEINLSYTWIDEGKQVQIAVTDTGYGIPLEKQADIFKRFEKLDDYKPGAGLGLSICSLIAEHLGGSICIDSTYTNGARFVFTHPCEIPVSACNQQTRETT